MDPDLFSTHSLLSNKISSRIRFVVFLFFFFLSFFVFFFFLTRLFGTTARRRRSSPNRKPKRRKKKKKESHDDKEVKPVLLAIHWPMFCISFFFVLFLLRHWYFSAQCNSKGRIVPLLLRFHRFLACLSHLVRIHLSDSWKGQENIKSSHQNFA